MSMELRVESEAPEVPPPDALPAAEAEEEQHEGLLENDLYLLTQGQGQEAPRNERSKRRKRASPDTQHRPVGVMEPLALPAPADAAIAAEATADAAAADAAPGAAPAAAEASPEMSPEDVAAEMERARKRKKFESKPVEARKEGEEGDWILFPSLAAASRETGVPNGSIASLCTLQGSHTGRFFFGWAKLPIVEAKNKHEAEPRNHLPHDMLGSTIQFLKSTQSDCGHTSSVTRAMMANFQSPLHALCFSLLVLPSEGQSSDMRIVILPDQVLIIVVIGVIAFGACCGIFTVLWRNRRDLVILMPEWMSFHRKKEEKVTEADRILFERAEQRRQKRELREAAEADEEEGGGSYLDLPTSLPGTVADKGSEAQDSRDTSLPLPSSKTSAATESGNSSRFARKQHRKISRASDPGHAEQRGRPRPAQLDDAVAASDPLSRWKHRGREPRNDGGADEDELPSSSRGRNGRGRRHSVGASPELMALASPAGMSSMGLGRSFGRAAPASGPWEASIHERGSTRASQYKLRFLPDHRVAGSTEGADGTAQISGSFNPDNHRVIWTEAHPWGSVKVTGRG
eukprot:s3971_g5.t2